MISRVLAGILLLFASASISLAQRLPQTVRPSHYQLRFEPDFAADRFSGEAVIDVQLSQAAANITLHAVDLNIESASIRVGERVQQAAVTTDRQSQTITLNVAESLPEGPAQISIRYSAAFGSGLRGFYSGMAGGRKYAATDFEPFDARRMFPAFDEPAMKATFDITAVVPRGDMAISNSPIVSEKNGPSPDKRTVRFATTPKMSTYLVALIVGGFECAESRVEGTPVRVCATPDKKRLTGFAMEAAQVSLRYFNRYFSMRYPFAKLDLIALPDFAAGAMENTGAVTFREALLLADPKEASLDTRKRIAVVIAHELAHQWFGDLVTMEWWDDIWLNEGFASWMETKPLTEWKPEWQMGFDEVMELGSTLEQDARRATRPIRVSSAQAQTQAQVESLFDGIAYGKAATVLRMVENYVGEQGFRAGVNDYLQRHAYSNTRAADFWNSVARATGKPVDKIMSTFVDQPGVPLVSVRASCTGNQTEVTLAQRRFFADGSNSRDDAGNSQLWHVPVCLKSGDSRTPDCRLLSEKEQIFRIEGCTSSPPVVFANAGAEGYYISDYDGPSARALRDRVNALSHPEQVILLINEWSLITAGRRDLPGYLELAEAFRGGGTTAAWEEIAANLRFLSDQVLPESAQDSYRLWLRNLLRPLASKLGFQARRVEAEGDRELRATVLFTLGRSGQDPEVLQNALTIAEGFLQNRVDLDPTLAGTVLNLAAWQGDSAFYDRYLERMRRSTRPDEFYGWLSALTAFRDPALLRRTLDLTLTSEVRGQDAMRVLSGVMGNPAGRELAWDFLRKSWPELQKKMPPSNLARFASMGRLFCTAERRREFQEFFTEERVPGSAREVQRSLESINSCMELRRTQAERIVMWLAQQLPSAHNFRKETLSTRHP